jgi:hypothetical protein
LSLQVICSIHCGGRELSEAAGKISAGTGLAYRPSNDGDHIAGVYRQRITLSSGRFAMIDDGLGYQLVPWRPSLEPQLGRHVSGVMMSGGRIDWSFGRKRGLGHLALVGQRFDRTASVN